MSKKVTDISEEPEVIRELDKSIKALMEGLRACVFDFGYHIKAINEHDNIYDYRHSIQYRLFSTRLHFHLLCRHVREVRIKHQHLAKTHSQSYVDHLERDKREISALLDSIVFHLYSAFDYLASFIHHIITKTKDKKDWQQLVRAAKGNSKLFNRKGTDLLLKAIVAVDLDFVSQLNTYRNKIIHDISDVSGYEHIYDFFNGDLQLYFLATKKQYKIFRGFKTGDGKYTTSALAQYLIEQTFNVIAKVLFGLKTYMELNSNTDEISKHPELGMVFYDIGNNPVQLSTPLWKIFENRFSR